MDMDDAFTQYGFTTLPADQTKTAPITTKPAAVDIKDLEPPHTPLADRIDKYAKTKLSPDTYRHSLRVYSYGRAIAQQCFPQWGLTSASALDETWFLTALLHDIGTTDDVIHTTRLSYEFYAGYHALDILQDLRLTGGAGIAPRDQAESVAEAIIRHQDVQDKGNITLVTRLIHLGTLLDNIGAGSELIHPDTIRSVVHALPRPKWSGCFAGTVAKEKEYKPYTMVSRIEGFEEKIESNGRDGLMSRYD
jgi:cyanamide hydratase